MALTPESLVQMAVANLGQTEIVSDITTSPATKAEKLGQLFYVTERDRILAKHSWSWATRRAALTDVTTAEITTPKRLGWTYAYTLPSDLVRVIDLDLGYRSGPDVPGFDPVNPLLPGASWSIEMNTAGTGRVLLCDIQTASLVYTARITDLTLWDPDAVEALTWGLSFRLAMPLAAKSDYAQLAKSMADEKLNKAIADDANEAHPDHVYTSEIITSRIW